MADDDSANPVNEEREEENATKGAGISTATAAHRAAVEAKQPLEKQPEDSSQDNDSLTDEFNDPNKLPTNKIPVNGKIKKDTVTVMELEQMSMGQMFNMFLELIAFLLKGDWESFILHSEDFLKTEVVDITDKEKTVVTAAKKSVEDMRDLTKDEKFRKASPEERLEEISDLIIDIELLKKTGIDKLIKVIFDEESYGGDPDVVFNYTGGPGFMPGDVTPGGLYVGIMHDKDGNQIFEASRQNEAVSIKKFSESKVDDIIKWQSRYRAEPGNTIPSSALGAAQFVGRTLEEMRDKGFINGDRIFDLEAQIELAIKRKIQMRGFGALFKEHMPESEYNKIAKDLKLEWQGLQSISNERLVEMLKDIRQSSMENLSKEELKVLQTPENVKQLNLALTSP